MIGDARRQALDRDSLALAEWTRRHIAPCGARHQRLHQGVVAYALARDGDHQLILILDLELLEGALERILVELCRKARDDLIVNLATKLDRFLTLLVPNEPAHSCAGLAGGDKAEPRWLRVLRFRSQDFDLV